ncbi:hypothetical protein [Arthrobacter roseus]|uniref:hypothetical protein n=1 Tax=Arthrobacter roseus TaxID=136274 RepID=UPI001962C465|nr:hypothetical protein [Arthrobacter roseus]MBM7849353.1 cytosine/uracil/thiamine/allantoin permease [Arthrobacter roseus]
MSTVVEPRRHETRTGTVVWGLIVVVIGLAFITAQLTDIELDPVIVLLVILLGSGLALVAAGFIAAARGRNRTPSPHDVTSGDKGGNL